MTNQLTTLEFAARRLTDQALASRLNRIAEEPRWLKRDEKDALIHEAARRLRWNVRITESTPEHPGKIQQPTKSQLQQAVAAENRDNARRRHPSNTGNLRTKTGKVLTNADIDALADEAEAGYDIEALKQSKKVR